MGFDHGECLKCYAYFSINNPCGNEVNVCFGCIDKMLSQGGCKTYRICSAFRNESMMTCDCLCDICFKVKPLVYETYICDGCLYCANEDYILVHTRPRFDLCLKEYMDLLSVNDYRRALLRCRVRLFQKELKHIFKRIRTLRDVFWYLN